MFFDILVYTQKEVSLRSDIFIFRKKILTLLLEYLKKYCFMNHTYQIQINESVPLGQSIIALLRSASDVVSFTATHNNKVQKSLKSGF